MCGGIADHLGVPVLWVRLAFAVLAALEGAGVVAYALLWMFVRQGTDTKRLSAREQQQGIGLILLSFGLMLLVGAFFALPFWLTSPFLIALLGATMTWWGIGLHLATGFAWAVFHILIIVLQAFIFMMLTLVYLGQAHEGH